MNPTTADTRRSAWESGDKDRDLSLVFAIFCDSLRPLGAVEVAEIMHRPVTSARPRVTELLKLGKIQVVGRRKLPTGSSEAVYIAKRFDGNGQGLLAGVA